MASLAIASIVAVGDNFRKRRYAHREATFGLGAQDDGIGALLVCHYGSFRKPTQSSYDKGPGSQLSATPGSEPSRRQVNISRSTCEGSAALTSPPPCRRRRAPRPPAARAAARRSPARPA